jgi:hypothetical protein
MMVLPRMTSVEARSMGRPVARCPIRDEPCTLCVPGATGPQDCGLVWLVKSDPLFAEELRAAREARPSEEHRDPATPRS